MSALALQQLACVPVPDTPLIESAIRYARRQCDPYLFDHVMRSWLFAAPCPTTSRSMSALRGAAFRDRGGGAGAELRCRAGVDERRAPLIRDSVALSVLPADREISHRMVPKRISQA